MTLSGDLRYALRLLGRAPVFTISTILVVALGLGATTAVFSLVYALLLKPLPYANADRLVVVWEHNVVRNRPTNVINAANFLAWKERNRTFEDMAIFSPMRVNLTGSGEPEELDAMVVSASLLSMVGAPPMMGRVFSTGEDLEGASPVALISEGLWTRRFGRRADILGQSVTLSERQATIVGVLPATFEVLGQRADVWRPLILTPAQRAFRGRGFLALGLLAPGVTRDQAQADMAGVAEGLVREQPDFNSGWTVNVVPLRTQLTSDVRPALYVLMGAVMAVLLIVCANLANLLLARATTRAREMAVRAALGAGAARLSRQLLTEVAVLIAAGGVAGLLLASWLQSLIVTTARAQAPVPLLGEVVLDGAVVGFAAGATAVTALLCALAPIWTLRGASLVTALRDGGRGTTEVAHGRLRASLVVAEVTLAVALLAGAGLLVRSVLALQAVDPGFDPSRVLTMQVILSATSPDDAPRVARFHQEAVDRLRSIPGVRQAAGTVFLPLAGQGSATSFWMADRPEPAAADRPVAEIRPVTPGYFETMGIPRLAGRDFDAGDTPDRPLVAVVNETFARRFSSGENPIGRRLTYSWDKPTTVEVVGVVGDVRLTTLDGEVRATVYLPNAQRTIPMMTYALRTEGDPLTVAGAAIEAVRALAPNQPVSRVRALNEVVGQSLARPRIASTALLVFAAVALLLAAIGVYGVIAYSVSQRWTEFGVRLALGASPGAIRGMVVRRGLGLVLLGLALGLAAALPLARALESQLFGVRPFDWPTYGLVAAVMGLVGLAASWIPALRATRMDPAAALRAD
ncbi:MAG: ABC transporter permease [Acidobacteria bacterium]|nr:ABC transporter permease [Acidobacteriota bacterium]